MEEPTLNLSQLASEAFGLMEEEKHAEALQIWLHIDDCLSLDVETRCSYLLCMRKCYASLGQYDLAKHTSDRVREIDQSQEFFLNIEYAQIEDLFCQGKKLEGITKLREFWLENNTILSNPRHMILSSAVKLNLACNLAITKEPHEALNLFAELLPVVDEEDQRTIYFYRGYASWQLRQYDVAMEDFNRVTNSAKADWMTARSHYELGMIYYEKEAFAWAKQHLQNAEKLKELFDLPVRYIYIALSNACTKLRELEEARRYRKLAGI